MNIFLLITRNQTESALLQSTLHPEMLKPVIKHKNHLQRIFHDNACKQTMKIYAVTVNNNGPVVDLPDRKSLESNIASSVILHLHCEEIVRS